jgi:hypothetical protein
MPAKKSIKSLLDKLRKIIKGNASVTQEMLIRQLNPVVRGWAMYHSHIVAKATFSLIDSHIWRLLWKWARRRHPTKGARWVKQRYFRTNGQRSWNFATKGLVDSSTADLWLFRATTVAITRHVNVRGPANPFDRHGRLTLLIVEPRSVPSGCPVPVHGAEEWLEPDATRLACPVLRGRRRSNAPLLPDNLNVHKSLELVSSMRCELADFIGARSSRIGCSKAVYTAATNSVRQSRKNCFANGRRSYTCTRLRRGR